MRKLKGFYDLEMSISNHSEFGQIIISYFLIFIKECNLAITENGKSGYYKMDP